ncbi:hypothetical protein BDB00DRAFT_875626 [Zychaea mexicana]|uniref:uncharacterized protein n=1 Tax=Zychaea mexicana TaxID=64656 RepID=UPI0022FDDDBC|nr:uncharacterized protein BDB00DRAFT_875626 [Zychaea mexicana]KAI9490170.1 hypothetical protein BDB00DRAFT_875626 [Zychaea mexicana]
MLLTNHYTTPPHEPVGPNDDSTAPKPSSRRPSLDPDSRTLFPLSSFRHHPYSHLDRTAPSTTSASSSRRGSLTDPALHATCRPPLLCSSPPPSPSQRFTSPATIRPSTSDQADLTNRFLTSPPLQPNGNNNNQYHGNSSTNLSPQQHASSPWRRDSLPSISHLTRQQPLAASTAGTATATKERHPLSNGMWLDDLPQASPSDSIRRHSIAVSSSSNGAYYGSPLSSAASSPRVQPQSHPSPPQQYQYHHHHHHHHLHQEHDNNNNSAHPLRHAGPPLTSRQEQQQQPPPPPPQSQHYPQGEASMSRRGSTAMYSRSPELRVSHKLAERKRRKEMKDLFDELRDILPVDKGLKTSKWEILSKALDYISILQQREDQWTRESAELRRELASLKNF